MNVSNENLQHKRFDKDNVNGSMIPLSKPINLADPNERIGLTNLLYQYEQESDESKKELINSAMDNLNVYWDDSYPKDRQQVADKLLDIEIWMKNTFRNNCLDDYVAKFLKSDENLNFWFPTQEYDDRQPNSTDSVSDREKSREGFVKFLSCLTQEKKHYKGIIESFLAIIPEVKQLQGLCKKNNWSRQALKANTIQDFIIKPALKKRKLLSK